MEQDKTIKALQTAIQMEIDGKKFYVNAASGSKNVIGRKLLSQLAEEEEIHRNVFKNIYDAIQSRHSWPKVELRLPDKARLSNLFTETESVAGEKLSDITSEMDIVRTARQMEANTYDFYTLRSQNATAKAEKELYNMIAEQEQQHNLALADYYEFLQNPAGWYVKKEHPNLD